MADNTILYGKWYFNETIDYQNVPETILDFNCVVNEELKTAERIRFYNTGLVYDWTIDPILLAWTYYSSGWENEGYRTIVITGGGSDTFLAWLNANATKVSDSLDIEGLKTNKMVYNEQMNELTDVINEKTGSSGEKNLSELIDTAKSIVIIEEPSGTINLTTEGEHDVKKYAKANVIFPSLDGETRSLKEFIQERGVGYLFYNINYIGTKKNPFTLLKYEDTTGITDFSHMFDTCKPQTNTLSANLNGIDLSSAENMRYFLYNSTNLFEINIDIPNAKYLEYFAQQAGVKTVVLRNSSKVTSLSYAFYTCPNLVRVEMDIRSVTNVSNLFYRATELTTLKFSNIKINLKVYDSNSVSGYGAKLTLESLLFLCQECINVNASRTLTIGSPNITKLAEIYVKLTGEAEEDETLPKLPMVQCESTDEGAMLVADYMALKQWSLA